MNDPVLSYVSQQHATLALIEVGEIRLYWLKLPQEENQCNYKAWLDCEVLSDEEQIRAAKFRMQKDQLRFISARKILRSVLALELGISPQDVPLAIVDTRPALINHAQNDIRFNISHSGDWVVVGFSRATEIGVDVELCRTLPEIMGMAERVMTQQEYSTFERLDPQARKRVFFRLWVAKEAILKYLGTGFRRAPDTVAIGLPDLNADAWEPTGPALAMQLSGADSGDYCWAVAVSDKANAMPVTLIKLNDEIATR